jgi:hypothetical protein
MFGLVSSVALAGSTDDATGAREIAEGVVWEPIIDTPHDPRDEINVSVGLSRYTLQPGAMLDLVALLGYGYAGPVQYYVEQGVMTITVTPESHFGYTMTHAPDLRIPSEGEAEIPERAAVYAPTGEIGPVRNNGDEPLVILVIAIVPDSIYEENGSSDYEEVTGVPASPTP